MPTSNLIGSGQGLSLADFSSEPLMVPELQERDTAGVIKELSQALQLESCIPDLLPFYHAALNREFLTSTALSQGLAFPHARLGGLQQLWFALGRSADPIIWGSKGALPVRLVFLVAVPSTDATSYLHLLSGLSRLGKENQYLEDLLTAKSPEEMVAILKQIRLRNGRETAG
ncbi:MAG: PTS sugar transporter subunit IIA [Chloroflexi bacterium]|nr:PTS sugar transporter subunit IIA [Chloroflexota bacterium]